ncbi:MAG: hypothetical protein HOE90_02375 [Bacteriovoracaceae bacterium]|jgi:hypothetical protein|nr:hypothetical protein [Bacteriovoracaceae bacterium]
MRKLSLLLLCFSASAFAQVSLDFKVVGSSYTLDFNRGFVCKVEPSFSEAPTLGYGTDQTAARDNAIRNCKAETGNHSMHCDSASCEPIAFEQARPVITITSRGGNLGVYFSSGTHYSCRAEGPFLGNGTYISEAPTRSEAEVYAQKLCMAQTGNARMHCPIEECHAVNGIAGSSDGVVVSLEVLGNLLPSKEERRRRLEDKISDLERLLENKNISVGQERRVRKKLGKKKRKLESLQD